MRLNDVTTTEAIQAVRDTFNFTVGKYPLSAPDNMRTPWYGLFREDTCKVVGNSSVTDRYTPHTTEDVTALVETASELFDGNVSVNCHFNNGHYVTVSPTDENRRSVFGTEDNIFPRIYISAGYDGKPFRASVGYFRDLCRNLAMLETVKATSVSIRHTHSLRDKMRDLRASFEGLRDGWERLGDVVSAMEARQVDVEAVMNSIYGQVPTDEGRSRTIYVNRAESIINRLIRERYASGRGRIDHQQPRVSAWEMFNAIQGHAQHDASRRGRPTEYDRVLLANRDAYVRRAESLLVSA